MRLVLLESKLKLEMEHAAYAEFLRLWDQGTFAQQRLGQAFYNYFQLHKLNDQRFLSGLYEADGRIAQALIARLFDVSNGGVSGQEKQF